jgi:ElaB/YqjD/DUF883 family membrane-anchored ribosome-binding protein
MNKILKIKYLVIFECVVLLGFTTSLSAQTKKNWEQTTINIPLPDKDYKMVLMRVQNTEGLQKVLTTVPNSSEHYPLIVLKEADALSFIAVLQEYKLQGKDQVVVDKKHEEAEVICAEKEKTWRGLDSIQLLRIANLKQYNSELTGINTTLSAQYKAAISTAKDANKGRFWSGFKDMALGAAAGLVIGFMIGFGIK